MKQIHPTTRSEGHRFVTRMIKLEKSVQTLMHQATGPLCAGCKKVCCQPEICVESLESPFLSWVRNQAEMPDFSPDSGWLCEFGCALEAGRPPVCYEYFCDHITEPLADAQQKWRLTVLGHLVSHAGKRALGDRHLVELNENELANISWDRLHKRMQESLEALAALEFYGQFGRNGPAGQQALMKIVPVKP